LEIKRSTVSLVLSIIGPDGRPAADSQCRRCESSSFSFVATTGGAHRVTIRSTERTGVTGRYSIRNSVDRVATPADQRRLAGESAFGQGDAFLAQWKRTANLQASTSYRSALLNWELAADKSGQVRALLALGSASQASGDLPSAGASTQRALKLAADDQTLRALTTIALSQIRSLQARPDEALALANEALELYKNLKDEAGQAISLIQIADANSDKGERQRSLEIYNNALAAATSAEAPSLKALALLGMGYAVNDLGDKLRARGFFKETLSRAQQLGDPKLEAKAWAALGQVSSALGEKDQAIALFQKAVVILRGRGDPAAEAPIHAGMAFAQEGLGDPTKALDAFLRTLSLWRSANYVRGEAETLAQLSRLYRQSGDHQRALQCIERAAAISNAIDDPFHQSFIGVHRGRVYFALSRSADSLAVYRQSLEQSRACKSQWAEIEALNGIGDIYAFQRDTRNAIQYYDAALQVTRALGDVFAEVTTLVNLARANRDAGAFSNALDQLTQARDRIETLREQVERESRRAEYFSTVHNVYELTIDVLASLDERDPRSGYAARAFEISEAARSRALLDSALEAKIDFREGADPALLIQERELTRRIETDEEKLGRSYAGGASRASIKQVEQGLQELLNQREEVRSLMRTRFASHIRPKPLSLAESQHLLSDDTVLLEYAIGEKRSFVWAVTSSDMRRFELPNRDLLNKAAGRFYKMVSSTLPAPEVEAEALRLGNLLVGPASALLNNKRLVIVPDGALHYVPFASLAISSGDTAKPGGYKPLVLDHEISYLPSLSVLAALRRARAQQVRKLKGVAVFADPVFSKASLSSSGSGVRRRNNLALRDLRSAIRSAGMNDSGISGLPSSREEADAIASAVGVDVFKATGLDASLSKLKSTDLSYYRVLHFATHGLIDTARPEMSSLILSLVNAGGASQNGFLRLPDICSLNLHAELVVLSACETAIGKEIRGEGLMSLNWAFMHAGASRVMSTLWKIDDSATAQLMATFYRKLFREGMSPARSLREAQVEMLHRRQWRSPFFWASFVLQGGSD
jgi:CHAT domain-containing protein